MTETMLSCFKGFVITKDKKCQMKFKNEPLLTYEQVKNLPEYAGILADNIVVTDFDEYEQAEIFMNIVEGEQHDCFVNQTTRGKHGFYKNNGLIDKCYTGTKLACGLTCDIKCGKKPSYVILKFNGEERFTEWDCDEIQELPKYFTPVQTKYEFLGMKEGDGRDSDLFSYELILQSNGFSIDEVKETIGIINKYILAEPLSDADIERITRPEAFQKEVFFKGSALQHDLFGNYLISQENIIKINGRLHIYQSGIYSDEIDDLNSAIRKKIPSIKKNQKAEVIDYIKDVAPERTLSEPNLIAFRNGIYNLETDEILPLSPEYVLTNRIPWDFNINAYCELTDKTLNNISCNDENIRKVIEEMIGYCFYRRNSLEKAFILTGEKANGKSTLLKVLSVLLGKDNVSALDLKNIGDRFSKASLLKKLANIGDDISDEFIPDPSLFKKITSGMEIEAEFKGQNEFKFTPYCKLIFSSNNIPRIKDKTGAVLRRLIIIPFNARFSEDDADYDPHIKTKLCSQESIEYLIQLGVQGLKRLMTTNHFTKSEKVQEQIEEYKESNNPVLQFVKDLEDGADYLQRSSVTDVYQKYKTFCYQNGLIAESNIQFGKTIRYLYGLESKPRKTNGKVTRMYVKVTDGNG